jgi:hypothetical protein
MSSWGMAWGLSWGYAWGQVTAPRIEDDYVNFVSEFEYVDFDGLG